MRESLARAVARDRRPAPAPEAVARRYVNQWVEPEALGSERVAAFVLILKTRGCYWADLKGCSMCGYAKDTLGRSATPAELSEQLSRALERYHDEPYVKVYPSGSFLDDREVDPALVRRRIGMVFQRPTVFPQSIFENAAFGLRLVHADEDEVDRTVTDALKRAGLWDEVHDDLDRSALALSGGQQQRLCIARALAVKPRVLLLDEPTSSLDPLGTQRIEATVRRLKEEIAIVIVTHNVGQAARISDRVAFFHAGRVVEVGTTPDILERPREALTEQFITGRAT